MSERDEDMPELSRDAAAAWQAFARSIDPDDGAQARVLQRVRARTKARRREAVDDSEDAPRESRGARRAAAAVLVMKSSAIAVGIAGTALLSIKLVVAAVRPPAAPPAPGVAVVPSVASEAVDPSPHVQSIAPVAEPDTVPLQTPTAAAIPLKPKRVVAAPTSVPAADRLKAETDLIERARVAVRATEYARAVELLEQHRIEFPNGTLVEERLAFAAIAACELGRADGSERARTFAKTHPRSPQLAAVRAACDPAAIRPMDPAGRQQ